MNILEDAKPSPSYFWSCLTLQSDCLFLQDTNTKLYYFGYCVLGLYVAFILTVLIDLKFWWSLDKLRHQVDECLANVVEKVKKVKMDNEKNATLEELTLQQIEKSKESTKVVSSLRTGGTINNDVQRRLMADLANNWVENNNELWTDDSAYKYGNA